MTCEHFEFTCVGCHYTTEIEVTVMWVRDSGRTKTHYEGPLVDAPAAVKGKYLDWSLMQKLGVSLNGEMLDGVWVEPEVRDRYCSSICESHNGRLR